MSALFGGAQTLRTKEYETIYILRSDVDTAAAEKVQTRVSDVITREQGKLLKVEGWGRRKLAYPVAKAKKGVYVYVRYVGRGGLVQELERNLKLADSVIKYQTILLNDHVNAADVQVDPEEIKFEGFELPPDEEEKETRERALGLVDFAEGGRSRHVPRQDEEYDLEEFDNLDPRTRTGGTPTGGGEEA